MHCSRESVKFRNYLHYYYYLHFYYFDQNEQDEVVNLEMDQEGEVIYECERCYKTFENVQGLEKHLTMHYPNDNV